MFLLLDGRYGEKYEAPNDCNFDNKISSTNIPALIPKKPARYARIINKNLNALIVRFKEKSGIA